MTNKALENPQSNGHERSKTSTFIMMFLATILIMNTISSEQYLTAQQAFQHTSTVWSLSSKTLVTLKNDGVNLVPPVEQLAKSHIQDGIKCPYPLIPIYNKVVPQSSNNNQRIPRAFHFAWLKGYYAHDGTSRCISPDMMDVIQKWIEHFPSYNIHFHDDESVDDLLTQEWPEFPSLAKIIQSCAMYGNAMTIDIWRQLILFRYGGVYVDLDMLPGPEFTEASIFPDDSAVFLSDTLNRPSQWCMAMEQRSPIAYFTLLEIMKNIQEMKDVSDPKLVWTTGPAALEAGYKKVIGNAEDASTVLG
jgi:mannosyltransferase OCH1-like enzyme